MSEALRCCPFCGGNATLCESTISSNYVRCTRCTAEGPFFDAGFLADCQTPAGIKEARDLAVAAWNTRAAPDA